MNLDGTVAVPAASRNAHFHILLCHYRPTLSGPEGLKIARNLGPIYIYFAKLFFAKLTKPVVSNERLAKGVLLINGIKYWVARYWVVYRHLFPLFKIFWSPLLHLCAFGGDLGLAPSNKYLFRGAFSPPTEELVLNAHLSPIKKLHTCRYINLTATIIKR